MNALFIFLLFVLGLMPSCASVLGPRAQTISNLSPKAPSTSGMIGRNHGVSNWKPGEPVVTIINTSQTDHAYGVETGADSLSTAFSTCPAPCIRIPAGDTVRFYPGRGFNGALTAKGSRHELNFLSAPGETWYDISMELGMSHETLGPSDHRPQADGRISLCGEEDLLGKANAAWQKTPVAKQKDLLASGYLNGTVGGELTAVDMDRNTPILVRHWYQLEAGFRGYMVPGSIAGHHNLTEADKTADTRTSHVLTNEMTITIY